METRAHYVLIGAFMLGGIVLAILFTLWLGSNRSAYDEYEIVFEQKISGLQEGANVLFNGIPVGQVANLSLNPDDPNQSLALVRVDQDTPVKTDTTVELELQGVTGVAVVQFVGGSPQAPLLKDVADQRVPQIKANLTGVAAAIDSAGELAINLQRLISRENAESVSRIIRDVEAITDVVADKETEIALIIDNVAVSSTEFRRAATNLANAASSVESTFDALSGTLSTDGKAAIEDLALAAENLNVLVADVSDIVDDNRGAIEDFTQQGLGSAISTINKANRLVDQTEAILLEFDRNPAAFLLGEGRPTAP